MKQNILSRLTLIVASLAVAGYAMAQDPPGPPPDGGFQGGPGGGPQGGPGGMRRPMPPGPIGMLMHKSVQKELGLTSDQIQQIREIRPPRPPQGPPPGGDDGPGGPGAEGQAPRPPMSGGPREMESKLKSILSESQFSRFKELEYQAEGPRSFMRPEVADELGLTDDQQHQIRQVMRSQRRGRPGGFGPGGPGGPGGGPDGGFGGPPPGQGPDNGVGGPPPPPGGDGGPGGPGGPPPMDGGPGGPPPMNGGPMGGPGHRDKALDAKLTAILTSTQKSKWEKMQGKKFEFGPER